MFKKRLFIELFGKYQVNIDKYKQTTSQINPPNT